MSFNESHIIVGPPGAGKTVLASRLVRRHLEHPDGVVFVHDPVGQFARHGCHVYNDVAAWRAAAAKCSSKDGPKLPRGAALGGSDEEITRLVLDLGKKCNSVDRIAVRFMLVYDEGSLRTSSGATYMGATDNEVLAVRRHRGIALVYNLQDPGQLTERFFRMATDVWLFRQTTTNAAKLEKLLILEPGELVRAGITRLPPPTAKGGAVTLHYLHVRVGQGIIAEAA